MKIDEVVKKIITCLSLTIGYPNSSSSWWQQPTQVVRPSYDGVSAVGEEALLVRRPIQGGSGDTSGAIIYPYPDVVGCWVSDYRNFSPWLKDSDTLYAIIEKNVNGQIYKVKSKWCPYLDPDSVEYFWDVYLDSPLKPVKAFAVNIDSINVTNPSVGMPDSMYLWLNKNPSQKIKGEYHQYYPEMFSFNLETQDSIWQEGDSVRINLEKIIISYTPDGYPLFNKRYFTKIDFAIDTSLISCMGFRLINFPQDSVIEDIYSPIIDSISHNLINGDALLRARIRDYSNIVDSLFYKIKWQNDSLKDSTSHDTIINDYYYYTISNILQESNALFTAL